MASIVTSSSRKTGKVTITKEMLSRSLRAEKALAAGSGNALLMSWKSTEPRN